MTNTIYITLALLIVNYVSSTHQNVQIKRAERTTDVSRQIITNADNILYENKGSQPVSNVLYSVEKTIQDHIFHFNALTKAGEKLKVTENKVDGKRIWTITLKNPLKRDETTLIVVNYIVLKYLIPHPAAILQRETQTVKYIGNAHFYSPYNVLSSTVSITTGGRIAETKCAVAHKQKPNDQRNVQFGPFENVPANSEVLFDLIYENNSPFLLATEFERIIEVSHWGNIAVEEDITLEHVGAKLKGSFSRYDFQREQNNALSSVKSFTSVLPHGAFDVYYRDDIGNISTSQLRYTGRGVDVDIRPRFPLLGGWNTKYKLGYNLPSYVGLYNADDDFILSLNFIEPLYENMVIDKAIVKFILPEGSENIEINIPFNVQRLPDELTFTYLDIVGRPTIVLEATNLTEENVKKIELHYVFHKTLMFREPLMLIVFFFLLFISVIIYVRLDFSLSKDESSELKLRISGFSNKIVQYHDKLTLLYQNLEEKLSALKLNKDVNGFTTYMKNFNNDYKKYTTNINELYLKLKVDSVEQAEKVSELLKLDKQLKELFQQQQTMYLDKISVGKPKAQSSESDNSITKKKLECISKIKKIISALQQ